MQQDTTTRMIDPELSVYVTFLCSKETAVAGVLSGKYLSYLGIEPVCLHIGTRSLSISREAIAQVKQLKKIPALLASLLSPVLPPVSSEGKDVSDGR